ncbi:redoxin domain-containing protein [Halobaculum sp. CBA1158]|uniref:peroxiredoxin n=1 Tax=Halobaculum sp. CBA1158 TaxID=2904243 RepID=UPI001F420D7B|nr:redoxin domain-containing protein [Halobaculum sp. CBA1158]UIP00533.1 redoxin domain-containing protein [Halobaculum sp. CBA1158]
MSRSDTSREPSEPLDVGDPAPDFAATLVTPEGDAEETAFSDLLDKPVLLSFYTVDFSPDCIEEWCAFRDFDWFASGDEVRVVGVSKSGPRIHRQFIDRLNLGFPLYADTDLAVSEAFGVAYRTFGLFRRSRRSCFLVDTDGEIRYRWLGEHWLDPTRDTPPVSEIHEAVREELGDEPETFGF